MFLESTYFDANFSNLLMEPVDGFGNWAIME
jgi:hypothetical protein